MRWLVTADLHMSNALPYSATDWRTGVSDRLADIDAFGDFLIATQKERNANGLLLLGDSFDRNLLDAVILSFASEWMGRVSAAFDSVIVLPGNHESHDARSVHFTTEWLRSFSNVFVPTEPCVRKPFALVPYTSHKKTREAIAKLRAEPGSGQLVLCLHTTFRGAQSGSHAMSEGLRGRDASGFSVALSGHLHAPQRIPGLRRGWYVGSPYAIDFRDGGESKSIKLLTLSKGRSIVKTITVPPEIAIPFQTLSVDLFDDGSVKRFDRQITEASGYLRVKVRGTKASVERFVSEMRSSLSDGDFRSVTFDRQIVRDGKSRSASLDRSGIDVLRALPRWLDTLDLPDEQAKPMLRKVGMRILRRALSEGTDKGKRRVTVNPVSLRVRNFGPIAKADLSLDNIGLVLVRAVNRDSTAADSNGAGKTTLLKAITWALFGRTIYGEVGNDVIKWGETQTSVTLCLDVDGHRVNVERVKHRKSSATIAIERHGEKVTGGVSDLQPEIDAMLGLDFEAFRNTVLFGQDDVKRFADPKSTDSARKAIFREILSLRQVDRAREIARSNASETKREISEAQLQVAHLDGSIAGIGVDSLRRSRDAWEESREREIELLEGEIKRLRSKRSSGFSQRIKRQREKFAGYHDKVKKLRQRFVDHQSSAIKEEVKATNERNRASAELVSAEALVESLKKDEAKLQGERCPLCLSEISKGQAQRTYRHIKVRLRKAVTALKVAQIRCEEAKREADRVAKKHARFHRSLLAAITSKEQVIVAIQQVIDGLEVKQREHEKRDDEIRALADRLAKTKTQGNAFDDSLAEAIAKKKREEKKREEKKARIERLTNKLSRLEFWIDAFGDRGLQSWMMDAVIPRFNERANAYLHTLTDGDIQVEIDTESVTKTGVMRDKFSLTATIEHNGETMPSGGQRKKIELAVGLGLMDLVAEREGANVNLLGLDEVFDGLDATGKQRTLVLLDELRRSKGTVIVVSHDPELRSGHDFDRVWTVVKRNGATRVKVKT